MCRRKRRALGLAMVLISQLTVQAWAQSTDTADKDDKAKPKTELSPSERAQRDADKVFQWIRFHADKPGAKPSVQLPNGSAAATTAAPAPAPAVARGRTASPERSADAGAARRTAAAPDRRGSADTLNELAQDRPTQGGAQQELAQGTPSPSQNGAATPGAGSLAINSPPLPETLPSAVTAPAPAPNGPAVSAAEAVAAPAPEPDPEPMLKAIKMVEPDFPRQLQSTLRSGTVQVRFTVQPDGSVTRAEAVQTSHRRLNSAALDAVNQWRFAPIARAREATVELVFRVE